MAQPLTSKDGPEQATVIQQQERGALPYGSIRPDPTRPVLSA